MGFAVCTFLGASSGMGKTMEYLADRPDDVRRGFFVSDVVFPALSSSVLTVLVNSSGG